MASAIIGLAGSKTTPGALIDVMARLVAAGKDAPVPMKPVVWADFLGVNAQLQWFAPDIAQQQVKHLQALGLSWVRLALHWMLLEPEEGKYELKDIDQAMLEKTALSDEKIRGLLEGKTIKKVIVVPGKMVNLVVA